MKKTKNVLHLYDALISGEEINMLTFCADYNVSVPTFRRYMALIREFLWEQHLKEIVYDKNKKVYVINTNNFKT